MKTDLHIHTYFSDGVFTPEKIVDTAIDVGLGAIAITDHDNVLAYDVANKYIKDNDLSDKIQVLRGIEVNTLYNDYEVHILGYFMDVNNSDFQSMIKSQQQARVKQTKEILGLLAKKEGIRIKFEDIKKLVAPNGSIGRPHIARAITSAGGTTNVMDAYAKYIHINSPVYVQRKTVSPHDAVEIIYDAGGIPVIAHPHDLENMAEGLIKDLMNYGLRGIEAYHRKHSPAMVEYFSSMAENLGLIVTGGSDFHAPNILNGQIVLGKNFIPEWVYDKLIEEKKRLDMAAVNYIMNKRIWRIEYSLTICAIFAAILFFIPTSFSSKAAVNISKWNSEYNKIEYMFSAMAAQAESEIVQNMKNAKSYNEREKYMIKLVKPYLRLSDRLTPKKYVQHYMNGKII